MPGMGTGLERTLTFCDGCGMQPWCEGKSGADAASQGVDGKPAHQTEYISCFTSTCNITAFTIMKSVQPAATHGLESL